MILADSSIWIDHLRQGNPKLAAFLDEDQILAHPFVIGELAIGALRPAHPVISALKNMEAAIAATHEETMEAVIRHKLSGTGIGWIDAHLLTSALLTPEAVLWTRDDALKTVASRLGVAF